jgi:Zn-finger nucleic acid-binding protein
MAGYREAQTELSVLIDDELRRELDAICQLANGALDRGGALIAAARRGLPALQREADMHAARNVERCPRCSQIGLASREHGGVLLQACIECGGVWLDRASVQRMFDAPAAEIAELGRRVDDNARSIRDVTPELVCPSCEATLARRRDANSGIRLDSCARHGTWFDRSELARFASLVAKRRHALAELEAASVEAGVDEIRAWFRETRP